MSDPDGYSDPGFLGWVPGAPVFWDGRLYRKVERYPEGFAEFIHDYVNEDDE